MSVHTNTKDINLFLPKIEIKNGLKKIQISGVSRMPDPSSFYQDLASELEEYFLKFNSTLIVDFYFDYINSGSTKWLYYILQQLEQMAEKGMVEVLWKYDQDDESIELTGDVLKSQISIPFKLVPVLN